MTRPNIAIQVNLLGRRASRPTVENLEAAKRILEYLRSTRQEGIRLRKPKNLELETYADASYGGEDCKSQTGVLITLGKQPVGWYSRRQDIVALSVTEAEYIAACEGAKDCAWGMQFLVELQIMTNPTLITDSEGALHLAKTSKFHRRSRHIEHRYHYIRQQVRGKHLRLRTIPGKDNPADLLTKLQNMTTIREWKKDWMSLPG